jgi:hypothetical protein
MLTYACVCVGRRDGHGRGVTSDAADRYILVYAYTCVYACHIHDIQVRLNRLVPYLAVLISDEHESALVNLLY